MFRIYVEFHIKEDKIDEFKALAADVVAKTQPEPGIVSYSLNQSTDDPLTFSFFEVYEDKAAHSAHEKTPHVTGFFPKAQPTFASDPIIKFYNEI